MRAKKVAKISPLSWEAKCGVTEEQKEIFDKIGYELAEQEASEFEPHSYRRQGIFWSIEVLFCVFFIFLFDYAFHS
jgi:hypothetical protein